MAKSLKTSKLEVWYRPDWPSALNSILGKFENWYAYVTDVGTIHLLGPELYEDPETSSFSSKSEIRGVTVAVAATSGGLV